MTGANQPHASAMIRHSGFPGNSQLMRREAIHICHTCPVMMQCRKYAETNNQICGYPLQGIWGGKEFTPRKYRRRIPR